MVPHVVRDEPVRDQHGAFVQEFWKADLRLDFDKCLKRGRIWIPKGIAVRRYNSAKLEPALFVPIFEFSL